MNFSRVVLWAGAAAACSPAIAHSIELVSRSSWSHYVIVAPFLLATCVWFGGDHSTVVPRVRLGSGILVFSMALQLLGIAGGSWSIAQMGLPLAAMGVALTLGSPHPLPMALSFWMVPLPYFLFTLTTPWAESILASSGGQLASMLGADVTVVGPVVQLGDTRLELESYQGGVITALVLAELGWYSAMRGRRPSWIGAVRRSLLFSSAVLVVQPVGVIAAVLVFCWQGPSVAQSWMSYGIWMLTAVTCTASIEFRRFKRSHDDRSVQTA